MDETANKKNVTFLKSKGGKIFAFGCSIWLLFTSILTLIVFLNWNSLTDYWGNTWQELEFTGVLREDLLEKYPSGNINSSNQTDFGSDGRSRSLVIEFINPKFDVPMSEEGRSELARSIAIYVVSVSPNIDRYDFISISFVSELSVGFKLSAFTNHQFRVDELLNIIEENG